MVAVFLAMLVVAMVAIPALVNSANAISSRSRTAPGHQGEGNFGQCLTTFKPAGQDRARQFCANIFNGQGTGNH